MIDRSKFNATLIEVVYKEIMISQFDGLKKYIIEHYENHSDSKITLDKIIKENKDSDFIDSVIDNYNEYDNFDQMLYSSQIVMTYSYLEFWLSKIAKKIEHRTISKVKLTDINSSSDLEKARKYISLVGDIDLSDTNPLWTELLEFKTIRNLIVHNGYNLFKHQIVKINIADYSSQEKEALRIINKNDRLSINLETGAILISDLNYPLRFCSICQAFVNEVLDKIILKYSS